MNRSERWYPRFIRYYGFGLRGTKLHVCTSTAIATSSTPIRLQCIKGKSVPLQAWTGPKGSRKLRLSDFVTTSQDGSRLSA
jgi:hypothetical protein